MFPSVEIFLMQVTSELVGGDRQHLLGVGWLCLAGGGPEGVQQEGPGGAAGASQGSRYGGGSH